MARSSRFSRPSKPFQSGPGARYIALDIYLRAMGTLCTWLEGGHVFTQMFSALSCAILLQAGRTTIFSATGHMHFALVYPLIQKWRRAGEPVGSACIFLDKVGVLGPLSWMEIWENFDGGFIGERRDHHGLIRQAGLSALGICPPASAAAESLSVPCKGQRFPPQTSGRVADRQKLTSLARPGGWSAKHQNPTTPGLQTLA